MGYLRKLKAPPFSNFTHSVDMQFYVLEFVFAMNIICPQDSHESRDRH